MTSLVNSGKFVPPKNAKKVARPPPEPESLRKLRALKERITREYEQEKREREAMENSEPIMPMSLASEKSLVSINKDGNAKPWSPFTTTASKQQVHPARVGYGGGHAPLAQDPADLLKEKLHQLKGGNKTWQHDLEVELSNKFSEMTQLKSQNRRLRDILTLREASNSRKEARLESEIAQLKNLMDDVCVESHEHEEILSRLRDMNYEIQEKSDLLKSTIEEQAEAERLALIRTYRVRIRDVKQQLASQESLNLEGAKAWIARFEMLEKDRADAADYLGTIEAQNQVLREAKGEIKVMQKHQDEQRKDLTHKIALVKRENKRFEEHIARLENQLALPPTNEPSHKKASPSSAAVAPSPARSASRQEGGSGGNGSRLFTLTTNTASRANTPAMGGGASGSKQHTVELTSVPPYPSADKQSVEDKQLADVIEQQQTEAIAKIRKVLEMIRTSLRQVRSAHIELLQERTELEIFLRKCIDDVRKDMYRAVTSGGAELSNASPTVGGTGATVGNKFLGTAARNATRNEANTEVILLQQYGVKERRELMDILNSKLQLLNILHQTMFPHKSLPEVFGDRLSALSRGHNASGTGKGQSRMSYSPTADEISQSIQFESDVDTLWQRWQTWVRTESPSPTFASK